MQKAALLLFKFKMAPALFDACLTCPNIIIHVWQNQAANILYFQSDHIEKDTKN